MAVYCSGPDAAGETRPSIVLQACLYDCVVSAPYDQDPGTAQRFTELWAKAFKEVRSRTVSLRNTVTCGRDVCFLICWGLKLFWGDPSQRIVT